jgi:uncharacterized membrane protein
MNAAQIHLALNHLPIFATLFGFLILLIALLKNSTPLKQAGLGLCLAAALGAIPTFLSGEPAEEVILSQPGIEEDRIEEHEEMALIALIVIEVLGAASLAGLYLSAKTGAPPPALILGCLVIAVLALALIGWTAHLGGQIHHPELRSGYQALLHHGPGLTPLPFSS